MKKLHLSHNRMIGGVVAGIAEAFNIDPTLLRLIVVFITIVTGIVPAVVTYLIAWIIIPEQGKD